MKKSVEKWADRIYPLACAALMCLVAGSIMKKHETIGLNTFHTVMDDVIGVASILIGFLGAMVGVVFALADNSKMKAVMRRINQKVLRLYIEEPIFVGMVVILLTIFYRVFAPCSPWQQSVYLAMMVWFLLSFLRIIRILMMQCFIAVKPSSSKFIPDLQNEDRKDLAERVKNAGKRSEDE